MLAESPPDTSVNEWLTALGPAQPTYVTLPTPGAKNELAACEMVAKALGITLMPWQRLFLATATELNADGSYRYKTVVLSTPRQCGKSSVLLILAATRSKLYKKHKTYFTAQNNMSAYEAVILNFSKEVLASKQIGKKVKIYKSATAPKIIFPNESIIAPFTPSSDGLHGRSAVNLVICDEIFSWSQPQGAGVMGAVKPTQLVAGKHKQMILTSTKGTAESTFLNGWLEKGRKATAQPDSTIAYMEWSMAPELDPYDMGNFSFHPALGHTQTIADIADMVDSIPTAGEYRRSVANLETATLESVLDVPKWKSLKGVLTVPKRSKVAIGWEVGMDGSSASIVAAWKDGPTTCVKVLMTNSGTSWLQDALEAIENGRPLAIGTDKHAENAVIADAHIAANPESKLNTLTTESAKTAAVAFKKRINQGTVRHDGHLALQQAVATAQARSIGEGWIFSHKSDPTLLAAVVACRLLDETKVETQPFTLVGD